MLYGLTYMSHLKNKTNKKTKLIGTENRFMGVEVGEIKFRVKKGWRTYFSSCWEHISRKSSVVNAIWRFSQLKKLPRSKPCLLLGQAHIQRLIITRTERPCALAPTGDTSERPTPPKSLRGLCRDMTQEKYSLALHTSQQGKKNGILPEPDPFPQPDRERGMLACIVFVFSWWF